jgi:protein-tyrosine-phosphatase
MSRLLFLCSGNTCRSPMAAVIARNVFGASHTVLSAGAETVAGLTAAKNAVSALAEMDLDLSKHKSVDVSELDMNTFDLIVIFRPSAAEKLTLPTSVDVKYLEVSDPYGGPLDVYRSTARLIQRGIRRLYIDDALRRITGPRAPASSHTQGILNRAANQCESEMASFVRSRISKQIYDKATLGQLAKHIRKFAKENDALLDLAIAVLEVNDIWKKVKHRDSPARSELIRALKAIQSVFERLACIEIAPGR